MSICTTCTPSWLRVSAASAYTTPVEGNLGLEECLTKLYFFLCSNLSNLLICLSLTFKYLNSLTLCINSWHFCMEVIEIMDASCDLHKSLCLTLLSRRLLMDLTLVCKRPLSMLLIIFLAFSVLTVFLNLMLTDAILLLIHLSMNIQWFL